MGLETKKDSISDWFDLRLYESASNLNLAGWYTNLKARAWLLELLRLKDHENGFSRENIKQRLINLLINPIITSTKLEGRDENLFNASLRVVQPISLKDVMDIAADVRKGFWGENMREMAEIFNTTNSDNGVAAEEALDKQSVEIHSNPLKPDKIDPIVWVTVDLNSSDTEIKESFNLWLKKVRRNFDDDISPGKRHRKIKHFSKAAMQSWYANRILPYLDLMLWNEYRGSNLTDEMLGKVIFPEQGESAKAYGHRDCTRAISDTVKPLARQLLSEKTLTRMMNLI